MKLKSNIIKVIIIIFFVVIAYDKLFSQKVSPFQRAKNDIRVELINGNTYKTAFNGGYNSPAIDAQDFTADGLIDLVMMNSDNQLKFYKNSYNFNFVPLTENYFLNANPNRFVRFIDIDSDGDYDLFSVDANANLTIQKNNGKNLLLRNEKIITNLGYSINIPITAIPAFTDIDADNDLDLFIGTFDGAVTFYENIGTKNDFNFKYITSKFGGISVVESNFLNKKDNLQSLHGASSIAFGDIDSDGDNDLFFGDYFLNGLLIFKNIGTPTSPQFNAQTPDTAFGNYGDKLLTLGFNTPIIRDFDGDNDVDLIVCSLKATEIYNTLYLFENKGTQSMPNFKQANILQNSELDFGSSSAPIFINDKLKKGFLTFGENEFRFYSELKTQPELVFLEGDRYGPTNPHFSSLPAVADIDDDGIADILSADIYGILSFWQIKNGRYQVVKNLMFDTLMFGQRVSPLFFDIDFDNDFDLLFGTSKGRILFYKNVGSKSKMILEKYQTPATLDSIRCGKDYSLCSGDINGDNLPDILLGYNVINDAADSNNFVKTGAIKFFIQENNNFTESEKYPDLENLPTFPTPAFKGYQQYSLLLVGNSYGGLWAFKDTSKPIIKAVENKSSLEFNISPNVIKKGGIIKVELTNPYAQSLTISDIQGTQVDKIELTNNITLIKINEKKYSSGAYFFRINSELVKILVQ